MLQQDDHIILKGHDKFVLIRLPTQRYVLHSIQIKKNPLHILCSQYLVDLGICCAFENIFDYMLWLKDFGQSTG